MTRRMTSTERGEKLRKKRDAQGLKELRGVWCPADRENEIKPKVRALIKRMTKC